MIAVSESASVGMSEQHVVVLGEKADWRGFIAMNDRRLLKIEQLSAVEQKTASAYDAAVRHFTNGEMTLKELVEVIDRTILPELTAAQARIKRLERVPYAQASLLAGATEYLKLREESWRARAAGLRRKSLGGMRPPDETERASLEVLDRIHPATPQAAQ